MFHRSLLFVKELVLLAIVLLIASSAQAQTSLSGVPARTAYGSSRRVAGPAFRIVPGDHVFQAVMKIERTYQNAERSAAVTAYRPPARRSAVREEAAPVKVSISEPEGATEMVSIRGPDGKVRSFPIAGGRKAIKVRTLIVHPGQSLNLMIRGGRVEVSHK